MAAQREVEAVAAAYETDTVTFDVLLQAQQRLAQAESDYFRSLVNYAKAISQVHYRKGSLLEYNGVYLAEGPWPAKAYFDARRRARARDAATYLDYGFTQPRVISRGPIEQYADAGTEGTGVPQEAAPAATSTPSAPQQETIPTPRPEPTLPSPAPAKPATTSPVSEPQASAAGSGQEQRGWTAVMTMPSTPAGRTADPRMARDGWSAVRRPTTMNPSRRHRLLPLIGLLQAGRPHNAEALGRAWNRRCRTPSP